MPQLLLKLPEPKFEPGEELIPPLKSALLLATVPAERHLLPPTVMPPSHQANGARPQPASANGEREHLVVPR